MPSEPWLKGLPEVGDWLWDDLCILMLLFFQEPGYITETRITYYE